MAALDPIENARARRCERRHVIGKQDESERKHPEAEYRKKAEDAAASEQHAGRDSNPGRAGAAQPVDGRTNPARQSLDQSIEAMIAKREFLVVFSHSHDVSLRQSVQIRCASHRME